MEIALSQYCGESNIITAISHRDEMSRQAMRFRGPQNYMVGDTKLINHAWARKVRPLLSEEVW